VDSEQPPMLMEVRVGALEKHSVSWGENRKKHLETKQDETITKSIKDEKWINWESRIDPLFSLSRIEPHHCLLLIKVEFVF